MRLTVYGKLKYQLIEKQLPYRLFLAHRGFIGFWEV
jgi:hypothetical protein